MAEALRKFMAADAVAYVDTYRRLIMIPESSLMSRYPITTRGGEKDEADEQELVRIAQAVEQP